MLGERGRGNNRQTRVWQGRRFEGKTMKTPENRKASYGLKCVPETHDVYLKQECKNEEMYRRALFRTGTSCFSQSQVFNCRCKVWSNFWFVLAK